MQEEASLEQISPQAVHEDKHSDPLPQSAYNQGHSNLNLSPCDE